MVLLVRTSTRSRYLLGPANDYSTVRLLYEYEYGTYPYYARYHNVTYVLVVRVRVLVLVYRIQSPLRGAGGRQIRDKTKFDVFSIEPRR